MDPSFIDDYHATQNLDYAVRHGRRAGVERAARDITNSAYEDVIGRRPATHRKEASNDHLAHPRESR